MAYAVGLQAVKSAINEGKARAAAGPGGNFSTKLDYFSWKDGDSKIVRFLTDDLIVAPFVDRIICTNGKTMDFLIDPDNNLVKKYGGKAKDFKTGELVEPKQIRRGVGVAVLRDEKPLPGQTYPGGGQKTEVVDYTYNKDVGGTQFPARWFGIIKQAPGNFWETLVMGISERYGTICDRDYVIKRLGGGLDTKYSFTPLDPVDELRDLDAVKAFYGYGKPWNPEDPNRFLYCPQTLDEWAEYYGGEERISHWLGGDSSPVNSTTPPPSWAVAEADEPQASQPATGTDFADLRSRLMPHLK